MTKEELVELVRLSLPLDHNPVLVEKYITMGYNAFVKQFFNQNGFQTEFFTKEYTDIDVLKNSDTELYYSTLPARILNVSRKGSGVWSIGVTGSPELVFAPLTDRDYKVLNELVVLKVSGIFPYTVLGTKVEYRRELIQIEKVNMRLLVHFDEFEDTDNIDFPSDMEIRLRDVVYQLMAGNQIKDMIIDGNEKTR